MAAINFPCSKFWLRIGKIDVIFSKILHGLIYNNNESKKLHKYMSQSFCYSLCKFQLPPLKNSLYLFMYVCVCVHLFLFAVLRGVQCLCLINYIIH